MIDTTMIVVNKDEYKRKSDGNVAVKNSSTEQIYTENAKKRLPIQR